MPKSTPENGLEFVNLVVKQREEEEQATRLNVPSLSVNDNDPLSSQDVSDVDADVNSSVSDTLPPGLLPPPPEVQLVFAAPFDEDSYGQYAFDPDFFPKPGLFDSAQSTHTPSTKSHPADPGWAPYPDRAHLLTHSLFNTPHIRFSVEQQQAILEWANAMGTLDVPTMYSLEKCQEGMRQMVGDASSLFDSDFSNRDVRAHMEFYPEDAGNHSSEIWHGEKLVQGHNQKQLTPMATHGNNTYFVDEVCEDAFENMVPVWDALEQREAEECSSTGLRSNVFCRTCKVGGSQKHKQSDDGYSELFQVSEFRTASDTVRLIHEQYEITFTSTAVDNLTSFQRSYGVKDSIAQPILERIMKRRQELQRANRRAPMSEITQQLRTEFSAVSTCLNMNPLLSVEGLDIHIDTPTEILHTLLLGIAKYLWVEAVHAMDKNKQFDLFCTRLRSTELEQAIQALLHDLAKCAPQLLVDKGKVHLLVHMPFFVLRFGPLLGPDTERYESFNSVFRECSIHSNRQAPSRDIAAKFAAFDRTRHVAPGGCWFNRETKTWQRAGPHVLALAQSSLFLRKILGSKDPAVKPPGSVVVPSKSPITTWANTKLLPFACPPRLNQDSPMRLAATFKTQCGDTASSGSHIAFRPIDSEPDSQLMLGRVHEIWATQSGSGPPCVLLYPFDWVPDDSTLNMPAVQLRGDLVFTTVSNVHGVINLQHRCASTGCKDTGHVTVRQERQDTDVTQKAIKHTDDTNFLVNIHSMHNYMLIRKLLSGRFDLQIQLGEPTVNRAMRNKAALRVHELRQCKEATEESVAEAALSAEGLGTGCKKRKRVERSSAATQSHSATAAAGAGTSTQNSSVSNVEGLHGQPPAAHHNDRVYAPPIYPGVLPPGWHPIWSFEHGKFYFHQLQTGVTTWEVPTWPFGSV
ncbi:hypothetical protein FRC06_007956 [Ceratobasidium sp. 370]|nr:hypothetical protein FRC06_007956 [Ceratobasidium sp. 370]